MKRKHVVTKHVCCKCRKKLVVKESYIRHGECHLTYKPCECYINRIRKAVDSSLAFVKSSCITNSEQWSLDEQAAYEMDENGY